jgi:hypothetical protein
MSVIRKYGNLIINLTKIISVQQNNKTLRFVLPLSNNFSGSRDWISDNQTCEVYTNSIEDAEKELHNIHELLNEYYKKKN